LEETDSLIHEIIKPMAAPFFRAKAQRTCANGGDACGCRDPLEGAVVVILTALRLRVKTLDLTVSTAAALGVVTLVGASSWSPDFAWYRFNVFVGLVFPCFLFFIFVREYTLEGVLII
jgi:hypothetical protein